MRYLVNTYCHFGLLSHSVLPLSPFLFPLNLFFIRGFPRMLSTSTHIASVCLPNYGSEDDIFSHYIIFILAIGHMPELRRHIWWLIVDDAAATASTMLVHIYSRASFVGFSMQSTPLGGLRSDIQVEDMIYRRKKDYLNGTHFAT